MVKAMAQASRAVVAVPWLMLPCVVPMALKLMQTNQPVTADSNPVARLGSAFASRAKGVSAVWQVKIDIERQLPSLRV